MGFTSELLKTVTFQGLSSTPARLIAAGASLVIWVLSVLLLVWSGNKVGNKVIKLVTHSAGDTHSSR